MKVHKKAYMAWAHACYIFEEKNNNNIKLDIKGNILLNFHQHNYMLQRQHAILEKGKHEIINRFHVYQKRNKN